MFVDAKVKVRYKETDQMGVAHHTNYYTWFEVGRGEFMREFGITYRQMEEMGFMLPVLETHCKYIKSALFEDELLIRTSIESYKGVRITMKYSVIRNSDNELLAEGTTVHAVTDKQLRPLNLKKYSLELYNMFANCI